MKSNPIFFKSNPDIKISEEFVKYFEKVINDLDLYEFRPARWIIKIFDFQILSQYSKNTTKF